MKCIYIITPTRARGSLLAVLIETYTNCSGVYFRQLYQLNYPIFYQAEKSTKLYLESFTNFYVCHGR